MHLQLAVNLLDVRRDRVAGDVQNGTDLCETHASGKKIENFGFRFEKGKVVEVLAGAGKEMLEALVATDENAGYLGEAALVGPYARLRPGAVLEEASHVGNFVELKKSRLGKGAKANHLTYLGDSEIGAGTNIGAGTITCNYDGKHKFKTTIGEGAFIGSNTALVAPVRVGDGALIGAGSVITKDVPDGEMGIARGRQKNLPRKSV